MTLRSRLALTAGAAGVCLAVAGCGSGTSPLSIRANSHDTVLGAYNTTIKAKSAAISLRETISAGGHRETVVGRGVADMAGRHKDAEFTLSVAGLGTIQERVVGSNVYVELPARAQGMLPGRKRWLSFNLNALTKSKYGSSLSQLTGSSQSPTEGLGYLKSLSNQVTRVGPAEIGGVKTTEYRATIDLAKATKDNRRAAAAIRRLQRELHRTTLPMRVWIDHQGRIRQLVYDMSIHTAGQTVSLGTTIDLSRFGVPVHVTAPPASQTFNGTKMAESGGSSSRL